MVWYGTWKAAGARFLILTSEGGTISTENPGKWKGKQYTEERDRPLLVAVGDREVTITGRYKGQSLSATTTYPQPKTHAVHDFSRWSETSDSMVDFGTDSCF